MRCEKVDVLVSLAVLRRFVEERRGREGEADANLVACLVDSAGADAGIAAHLDGCLLDILESKNWIWESVKWLGASWCVALVWDGQGRADRGFAGDVVRDPLCITHIEFGKLIGAQGANCRFRVARLME